MTDYGEEKAILKRYHKLYSIVKEKMTKYPAERKKVNTLCNAIKRVTYYTNLVARLSPSHIPHASYLVYSRDSCC